MININPKRLPGEKFKAYRARLRDAHAAIKRYLRGRVVVPCSQIVVIPVLGADADADRAVIDGKYRDVVDVKLKDGKETRIGRTKGPKRGCERETLKVRHGQGKLRRRAVVAPTQGVLFDDAPPSLRQRIGMLFDRSTVAS